MAKFSERHGFAEPMKPQLDSMDRRLKTKLWNELEAYLNGLRGHYDFSELEGYLRELIWTDFLAWHANEFPSNREKSMEFFQNVFFDDRTPWYWPYDLIEFVARYKFSEARFKKFEANLNECLKDEHSGYRFAIGDFTPLTNEFELASVADSASHSESVMTPICALMKKAVHLFSKKPKADYGNAIKESLAALESLCKHVCGDPNQKTLTPALQKATKELGLPDTMREGFAFLYKYANDNDNIRHGNIVVTQATEEEARYMLVTISAAINFIAEKARQLGKL